MTIETVEGKNVTLSFDGERCIHARRCVTGEPKVFLANVKGPWLHPDAASAEALLHVAMNCPSGAIQVKRRDGGREEPRPEANVVTVRENGPLAVQAELLINGAAAGYRATLCRCGHSANKPYCDGAHKEAGFTATGEPPSQETTLAIADLTGPVAVVPTANGPLMVTGNFEIDSGTGRAINRVKKAFLCRCGHSANKPYCDGSHKAAGFTAA